LEHGMLGVSLG